MIEEEERARRTPQASRFQPALLDGWDVADLREYIAMLQAEISRAEAAITAREKQRGAADALFRKS